MYFLMCFLVRVFETITGKITTEYLTPGYYRPATGVNAVVGIIPGSQIFHKVTVRIPVYMPISIIDQYLHMKTNNDMLLTIQ